MLTPRKPTADHDDFHDGLHCQTAADRETEKKAAGRFAQGRGSIALNRIARRREIKIRKRGAAARQSDRVPPRYG